MRKLGLMAAILALAAVGITACGGDDDNDETAATTAPTTTEAQGGGGGGETVKVSADPGGELAFQQASLDAQSGSVTFDFDNPAQLQHDFCIEGPGEDDLGCTDTISDSTSTLAVDLEPGDYTYYCSVDGHREAGMEGALTVK